MAKFNAVAANYYSFPPVDSEATIKINREKRGMCGGCGTRTFLFRRSLAGFKEYIPLTIEGIVHHGRCLYCYPEIKKKVEIMTNLQEKSLEQRPSLNCNIPKDIYNEITNETRIKDLDDFEVHSMPEPSAPPLLDSDYFLDEINSPQVYLQEKEAPNTPPSQKKSSFNEHHGKRGDYIEKQLHNNEVEQTIRTILNDMKALPHCAHTQFFAYKELSDVVLLDIRMGDFIRNVGGIPLLLTNMEIQLANVFVQQRACALLMILSHKNDKSRSTIVHQEGITQIIESMNRHSSNLDLICTGCGALWSITFSNNECRNKVVKSSIVPLILSLMELHIHQSKLHEWAIGLLHAIIVEEPNQKDIKNRSKLFMMAKIIEFNSSDMRIKRYARALKKALTLSE